MRLTVVLEVASRMPSTPEEPDRGIVITGLLACDWATDEKLARLIELERVTRESFRFLNTK